MKIRSMMQMTKSAALFGLVILLSLGISCKSTNGDDKLLAIVGTGTCEEILKKLAEAYNKSNPSQQVLILQSIGSGGGIKAVGNDEYILGRVARRPKGDEVRYGLSYLPFARDAVVFAVGDRVNAESLTQKQLLDIYSGKVSNWKDLGANDAPIRVLAREDADTSYSIIKERISRFDSLKLGDHVKIAYHDHGMIALLGKYPSAIGWLTGSSVNPHIHPVSLDGIAPTAENISAGRYPLQVEYAFIYKDKRLNKDAKEFIDFVFSGQGRGILQANQLVCVTRE